MSKSIVDRFREKRLGKRQLDEQQREELKAQIIRGELETAKQKEVFRTRFELALSRARGAVKNNDSIGKANAMKEMKLYYGCYRYMNSVHDAFRALHTQVGMQEVTQQFADAVQNLSTIQIRQTPVNFARLTRDALKNIQPMDLEGVDEMVNQLLRGSIEATESNQAEDTFLEALINGTATLNTPYPSKELEALGSLTKTERDETKAVADSDTDDVLTLLNQMAERLSDQ